MSGAELVRWIEETAELERERYVKAEQEQQRRAKAEAEAEKRLKRLLLDEAEAEKRIGQLRLEQQHLEWARNQPATSGGTRPKLIRTECRSVWLKSRNT
jgi:hypothetical protein